MICIGPGTEDLDAIRTWAPELELFELDQEVITAYRQGGPEKHLDTHSTTRFMQRIESQALSQAFRGGVRQFACRSYWERLWIVQEVAMSKEKVVVCGGEAIPWKLVSNILKFADCLHGPMSLLRKTDPLQILGSVLKNGEY